MNAHEAATGRDELEQVLPAFGLGHAAADAVVEENGVELAQRIAVEQGRVFTDGGFECSSPLTKLLESLTPRED